VLDGDDPKQGVIEGNSFLHPDLKLKFTVPNGFAMQNGARAVSISGSGGQGQFTTGAYSGDRARYIDSALQVLAGSGKSIAHGGIQNTRVNGILAFYAQARVSSNNSQVDVTVFAYEFSKSSAFHFATIAPAGKGSVFSPMYQSIRKISIKEAAGIKARKIDVVTVKRGDTISGLASKMAYDSYQQQRFLVLNRMRANQRLQPGQKVKIVTY